MHVETFVSLVGVPVALSVMCVSGSLRMAPRCWLDNFSHLASFAHSPVTCTVGFFGLCNLHVTTQHGLPHAFVAHLRGHELHDSFLGYVRFGWKEVVAAITYEHNTLNENFCERVYFVGFSFDCPVRRHRTWHHDLSVPHRLLVFRGTCNRWVS